MKRSLLAILKFLKRHLNLIFLLIGLLFFVKLIVDYDMAAIWGDLKRVGLSGISWLMLVWLISLVMDTASWKFTFGQYRDHVPMIQLAMITLAGQAINAVAPSGNLGEVLKGKYLGQHIGGSDSVSSVVIYNYIHFASDALMLVVGAVCTLFVARIPLYLGLILLVIALGIVGLTIALYFVMRLGLAKKLVKLITRLKIPVKDPEKWVGFAGTVDKNIRDFYHKYPKDFLVCSLTKCVSRTLAIVEVWLICYFLGQPISAFMALFIMSVSQLLFWAFAIVPGQVGVMEKGSDMVFGAVGYKSGFGFTFELVRRARRILQIVLGLLALLVLNLQNAAIRRRMLEAAPDEPAA